jgi:IS1 family transposase
LSGENGNENSQRLEEKLSDLGVNYGSIARNDWNSFAVAFKGENHRIGKKHTVV